jgi:hypothetical protein
MEATGTAHALAALQCIERAVCRRFDHYVCSEGLQPVDAEYAYRDPVYEEQPKCLPAGESLIWALAKETGRFESQLRYPGEDGVYENPKMDALRL